MVIIFCVLCWFLFIFSGGNETGEESNGMSSLWEKWGRGELFLGFFFYAVFVDSVLFLDGL